MAWVLLIAAWFVGESAVTKLDHHDASGTFVAAFALLLVIGAIATFVVRGED